jgi:hypothetical protein
MADNETAEKRSGYRCLFFCFKYNIFDICVFQIRNVNEVSKNSVDMCSVLKTFHPRFEPTIFGSVGEDDVVDIQITDRQNVDDQIVCRHRFEAITN